MQMITYEIVLKNSWLKQYNLAIDWKKEIFTFERCEYVIDIKFTRRQNSTINEIISKKFKLVKSTEENFIRENFDSLNINNERQLN